MLRSYASYELTNGEIHNDLRITYSDKARAESTARNRGWDAEKENIKLAGFLAWAAAKRLSLFAGTYEEFIEQLVDVALQADDSDDDKADPEDPTQPGA